MKIPLRYVAGILGLEVDADREVTGWSVDSRTLQPGDLFFALRGPNHDGNAYIGDAFAKGAAAVVADRDVAAAGIVLQVEDSLQALQSVAARARERWRGDVVAVTGSAGKTTTKDVIAEMLATRVSTTKTGGNLNNHVGLPLSLLRLDETARVAVIEMGMNHAGEIRELAGIAKPQVGVVTNVGYAHIENFESTDDVAAAKRELIEALPRDGIAVLNADDPRVAAFAGAHPGRTVLYGQSPKAQVRAEDFSDTAAGVRFRVGSVNFESPLIGRHSVSNLLAGIAVAGLYEIPAELLTEKVRQFQPGKMRGERLRHSGVLIYNDCYNSNPDAARAMIEVLRDTPARQRIAILGEMLELGRWAERLHREIGAYVTECGIDVLIGIRGAARQMVEAAQLAGMRTGSTFFFEDPAEAGHLTRKLAQAGDAILFKGSRGVHVERALEQFLVSEENGGRN